MSRRVNCGKFWTVLSTECWLRKDCNGCIYRRYCASSVQKKTQDYTIKIVISQLLEIFGEPPEKLIKIANGEYKVEKKDDLEYYKITEDF